MNKNKHRNEKKNEYIRVSTFYKYIKMNFVLKIDIKLIDMLCIIIHTDQKSPRHISMENNTIFDRLETRTHPLKNIQAQKKF